jgi:hypothetical protein
MPGVIVADGAQNVQPSADRDTRSPAISGDAADLIAQLWTPNFPSPELLEQAAALIPGVRHAAVEDAFMDRPDLAEGSHPFIRIGPGCIEVRGRDFAREQRALEREVHRHDVDVRMLADYFAEHGEFPSDPTPTRVISEWSAKSRSNMRNTLGLLDFTPMFHDLTRLPAMLTLTYPGDWLTVVPTGRAMKKHMKALRKRFERAWGETLRCVWKLEFQRRGAPHVHMLMVPPHGQRDGMNFRQWVSRAWADVVAHPDLEEYRKHLLAGTGLDYGEGSKARDPKNVTFYFLKHSTFQDKEYQHIVPEEWSTPETGPGRFWGYWGLEKTAVVVEVDHAIATLAGRTMRRWSAAQQSTRRVSRPRVRGGRVIQHYADVQGLAGAYLIASRPAPKYRKTQTRSGYLRGNRGYLMVNNGAEMASQLARYLSTRQADQ